MSLQSNRVVLTFFDGFDRKARAGFCGGIESDIHFNVRVFKRKISRQQVHSGFYVAYNSLVESLRAIGCDVRVNDFKTARANPDYPICMAGYTSIFKHVDLPNPILFGPGSYGLPEEAAPLKDDDQFVKLMKPSQWTADLWRPYCGDKMWVWYAGIDTNAIGDFAGADKRYDCLIYDKIMFDRDVKAAGMVGQITDYLEACGKTYKVIRRGRFNHAYYLDCLRDARSLIFMSEHESQGLACQEALAANVPVLAWDEGVLQDPVLKQYSFEGLNVSSVPYFDERCGERFTADDFEDSFDDFWIRLEGYAPRAFVEEQLSMRQAAENYWAMYQTFIP